MGGEGWSFNQKILLFFKCDDNVFEEDEIFLFYAFY